MIVQIPTRQDHEGYPGYLGLFEIADNCPVCGGPRGKVYQTISYDGSRRLHCDGWDNPCGHIDRYSAVRDEGKRVPYPEHPDPPPYSDVYGDNPKNNI